MITYGIDFKNNKLTTKVLLTMKHIMIPHF